MSVRIIFALMLCTQTVVVSAASMSRSLQQAVIGSDLLALKRLLAAKTFDIDARDMHGNTALGYAARYARRQMTEILLASGANARLSDNAGKTPFRHAVENAVRTAEHAAVAAILLKAVAGVEGRDAKGWSPLHWAVLSGDRALVQQLITEGASVWAGRSQSAVEVALLMQDEAMLTFLIEAGGGLDAAGEGGPPPLISAAREGRFAVVELLLVRGARVDVVNSLGDTALTLAAMRGHSEVVELLLEHGAEVDTVNFYGDNALIGATRQQHAEVVRVLLQHGATVDAASRRDKTALMLAARLGYVEIAELLLEYRAVAAAADKHGITVLMEAVRCGSLEIVKLLLAHGALVNVESKSGDSALMVAARRGDLEILRVLLQHGAEFTAKHRETIRQLAVLGPIAKIEENIRKAQFD